MTKPRAHFDALYARHADPWGLTSEWYERRKYAITLACLPRERYRRAFEPGCAIGYFTSLLAQRCDEVVATDFAAAAVESARTRVAHFAHVQVGQAVLPHELPDGRFDLIMVSEILYYFSGRDLKTLTDALIERLEPDGDLVAVHYREAGGDHGYDGFNVHALLSEHGALSRQVHHEDQSFVLDAFRLRPAARDDAPARWGDPLCTAAISGMPRPSPPELRDRSPRRAASCSTRHAGSIQ
jgi:protein-L-isoaspartate O-methyltransferase